MADTRIKTSKDDEIQELSKREMEDVKGGEGGDGWWWLRPGDVKGGRIQVSEPEEWPWLPD